MQQFIAYTIIGLTVGAIYALASSGLVLTYVTSGVFNIAHGAIGMISAFVYWQVRFDWGVPTPVALLIVLGVFCPLLGMVIERFVLRGLGAANEVTRLTVTVALMAGLIGAAAWIWPPDARSAFRGFYEGNVITVLDVNIGMNKIIALVSAIVVAVLLRFVLFNTRLGVQMRAVVDDRDLAELNGARPNNISRASWAMGSVLAGYAGILLAAEVQLNVIPLTLLVINAYAAAILGRLKSLLYTFVGAMALGLLEAYLLWTSGSSWFPKTFFGFNTSGIRQAAPTIFLFVCLLALPQAKLRAGMVRVVQRSREPKWSTSLLGSAVLVIGVIALTSLLTRANTIFLVQCLVFALAVLSLVPLTGYSGLVSLAPLTFAGLGAVFMAKLPGNGSVLTLVLTVMIVAVIGAVVALPALRLEGIYLALATGAFALLVSTLVFNQQKVFPNGSLDVPKLRLFGIDVQQPRAKAIMLAVVFALVSLALVSVRRSRLGRQMVAMKDSPLAGAMLGMNLLKVKTLAFALSAAIASLAGALDAGKVPPDRYGLDSSLPILLLAVVGGISSIGGAFFGGVMLGTNAVMATAIPSLANIAKVTPGFIGMTLGRNLNGVSAQIGEGFRPVIEHRQSLVIALIGPTVFWLLTTFDLITNWQFFGLLFMWTLGTIGLLPAMLGGNTNLRNSLLPLSSFGLIVGFASTTIELPTGGRMLCLVVAATIVVQVAQRRITQPSATAPATAESPDLAGLTTPFTARELQEVDEAIGVVP